LATKENNPRRIFAATITVALVIRLAIIPFLYNEWTDPFVVEHWAFGRIARSIVAGHGYGSPFADTGNSALLPPVYSYILAAVFRAFGSNTAASVIAAASLNSLISAFTCVPVYFIAKKCFGDRVALWSAWGWALSPYGIYFSADWLWSTCLFTLLFALVFLFALHLENTTGILPWIWFGVLCGATALTEPVILAVLPVLGVWICYRLYRRRRPWMFSALVSILWFACVVAPWIARNYQVFHTFIPVRDGFGLELYLGNSGYSRHWANRSVHPNHNDAELAEYVKTGEIAYMDHKRRQAMDFIANHPRWFAWMTMRRIVYLWTGYWSFDRQYLTEEPLDPPNVLVGTLLSALALAGLWRAFREKLPVAVLFAGVLLFFPLAYYISHPEAYYFRPLDPLILILGMYRIRGVSLWHVP
jgi:4-amino-4-deoxy-L-arabinose transferase-like glycosyltransferase